VPSNRAGYFLASFSRPSSGADLPERSVLLYLRLAAILAISGSELGHRTSGSRSCFLIPRGELPGNSRTLGIENGSRSRLGHWTVRGRSGYEQECKITRRRIGRGSGLVCRQVPSSHGGVYGTWGKRRGYNRDCSW